MTAAITAQRLSVEFAGPVLAESTTCMYHLSQPVHGHSGMMFEYAFGISTVGSSDVYAATADGQPVLDEFDDWIMLYGSNLEVRGPFAHPDALLEAFGVRVLA